MAELRTGHILMVINLHGNADLLKLYTGWLELLDPDVCWPDAWYLALQITIFTVP